MPARRLLALVTGTALVALPSATSAQNLPPPAQTDVSFYVDQNGTPGGPFDLGTLEQMIRSGALMPSTLVWTAGMAGWQPAREVAALQPVLAAGDQSPTPPPLPPTPDSGSPAFPPPGGVSDPFPPAGGSPGQRTPTQTTQVPTPQPPMPGANTPAPGVPDADQQAAKELQDFGVPETSELHTGAMHSPTPTAIPGGKVITTAQLMQLAQSGQPYLLLDALGGDRTLPGAVDAVAAASGEGGYSAPIQQQMSQYLQQVTGGNRNLPIVVYCLSNHCWMSYNVALRAIYLGYTDVLWYRGGVEAWEAAGLPTVPAQR